MDLETSNTRTISVGSVEMVVLLAPVAYASMVIW